MFLNLYIYVLTLITTLMNYNSILIYCSSFLGDGDVQGQELDWISVGPFQLSRFCDSVI